MNENIKFLLAEDKFVPEIHLRQPGFTQKTKKIKNSKKKQTHLLQIDLSNKLDKA